MKINIRVIPRSKSPSLQKKGDLYYVRVKSSPIEGRANQEAILCLSDYFEVPKSHIKILQGKSARTKVVEILT